MNLPYLVTMEFNTRRLPQIGQWLRLNIGKCCVDWDYGYAATDHYDSNNDLIVVYKFSTKESATLFQLTWGDQL